MATPRIRGVATTSDHVSDKSLAPDGDNGLAADSLFRAVNAQPTPARAESLADLRQQFYGLVNPNFVADAGAEYLPRLPRYLAAMELRLEKMEANLQRDAKRTQEIAPLWQRAAAAFAKCRAEKRRPGAELVRYRWLLEEYRITLFAQETGAFEAVSKEKLLAMELK